MSQGQVKVIQVLCAKDCRCSRCEMTRLIRTIAIKPSRERLAAAAAAMPHGKAMFVLAGIANEITATVNAYRLN